ncbi:MAG TPA: ankyrin repeat domain-containing protein [Fimbriimonadaceae bacterium]|nr:ankyrin repeat domain-containing protein [Fimbriimonadaceae bacterium]
MASATNLIDAVKAGNRPEVEKILAENDTLAAVVDDNGVSAVTLAVYYGHPDLARLIAGVRGPLSISEAAALGDLQALETALEYEHVETISPDGFTPLGLAAYFGHLEAVRFLLSRGARPGAHSQNPLNVTPLHSALAGGHVDLARLLLDAGSDPRAAGGEGWTPLHYAADLGDAELAGWLLERGADPEARNSAGQSPLDIAVESGHEHVADLMRAPA